MKSLRFLGLAISFVALALTGCKDPCKDVACQNGGVCDEGACICAIGYEGENCETSQRAKFIASYNVDESCNQTGNFNYSITIATSAVSVNNVVINNFYGVGASVSGVVNGSSINIPNQTVNAQGNAFTFSGSGQINGNILTLTYNVAVGTDSESCSATCTKQ